jgi:maltooligosyltrehalose trehalohydrolase
MRTDPIDDVGPPSVGCHLNRDGTGFFRVWVPGFPRVQLHLFSPEDRLLDMRPDGHGYHELAVANLPSGTRYKYRLGDEEFPDPVSKFQPDGVHGPSEVVSEQFPWTDLHWHGIPLEKYVIYELHIGTFSSSGTFEGAIQHLDDLVQLGISAIEIMPVAQFPGNRNWGYDGVFPFAVQNSYGGPGGLKALVNACHQRGLAVILDVVYNHLGPEGNYLQKFAPYFTYKYKTPWGPAVNYDDAGSDDVRYYVIQNALRWITEFHIDGLRLDAVHAIVDNSAYHILEELTDAIHRRGTELNRRVYVIAESDLNDVRLIRCVHVGGYGLDSQWNDDFHHSLHALLTNETHGYYKDFGNFQEMAQAYADAFVYSGRYSISRKRRHGNSARGMEGVQFVVYSKNHDQIGNRMLGERLSSLVGFEQLKLAAATVLLSPYVPMIFMGDEYGDDAPFQYFVSHSDPDLVNAVRSGRKAEFADFNWQGEPPDPQAEETFLRSKLRWQKRQSERNEVLWNFHRELLRLRRSLPTLRNLDKTRMDVIALDRHQVLVVRRWDLNEEILVAHCFSPNLEIAHIAVRPGAWNKILDSQDPMWFGAGSELPGQLESDGKLVLPLKPASVVVLRRQGG